jgi:hypothetical protein
LKAVVASPAVAAAGTVGTAGTVAAVAQHYCLGLAEGKHSAEKEGFLAVGTAGAVGSSDRQRWANFQPWEAGCVATGVTPAKIDTTTVRNGENLKIEREHARRLSLANV